MIINKTSPYGDYIHLSQFLNVAHIYCLTYKGEHYRPPNRETRPIEPDRAYFSLVLGPPFFLIGLWSGLVHNRLLCVVVPDRPTGRTDPDLDRIFWTGPWSGLFDQISFWSGPVFRPCSALSNYSTCK